MSKSRMTKEQLTKEAARWTGKKGDLAGFIDAPDAVPRQAESVPISIRVPKVMLEILREFARREGVGYQVLMKRWLDDRIRQEARVVGKRGAAE